MEVIFSQNLKITAKYYTVYDLNKLKPDLKHEIDKRLVKIMRTYYTVWIYLDANNDEKILKIEHLKANKQILTIYEYNKEQILIKQESYKLKDNGTIKIKHGWFYTYENKRIISGNYYEDDIPKAWWFTVDKTNPKQLTETYYKDGQAYEKYTKTIPVEK